jgi:radical SAM superfamily enzyme YgiQ (UPF0313 family)
MRVVFADNLLIDSNSCQHRLDLQPHLGLLSLVATAEAAGHDCTVYNPKLAVKRGLPINGALYENLAAEILRLRPDVVGLTALGCNFISVVQVAAFLKQNQADLPILLGGPHATILHREILSQFPQFDVIARHEAESIIVPLLDALVHGSLASVPGLSFRQAEQIISTSAPTMITDLDVLPLPAYGHHPIRELGLQSLRVEAGRGCPFSCTFCSTASFFGRKYRVKSPGRLLKELDFLSREFGISHFDLTHDLFTVDKKVVYAFCEAILRRNYTWSCSARMDCVDAALLKRMHASGCRAIYFGVETGSPRMQRISQKHLDLDLFAPTIDVTQQLGIEATVSLITGYPEELAADQDQTLDLIASCFERSQEALQVQLHLLTPEPGTRLTAEYAHLLEYDGHVSDFNAPTLGTADSEIMASNPVVFVNHHFYPTVVPRRRHVFVTSIYQILYGLGFPLLREILREYDGKLSLFIERVDEWLAQSGRGSISDQHLVDYMVERWGAAHYLSSLVRFMLAAQQLRKLLVSEENRNTALIVDSRLRFLRMTRYRLSRAAAILRDMHDCPELLSRLATHQGVGDFPPGLATLGHYLIYIDDPSGKAIRTFLIDDNTARLLTFLTRERSYSDCRKYFSRSSAGNKALQRLFRKLVEDGILDVMVDQSKTVPGSSLPIELPPPQRFKSSTLSELPR